jgi:hypothetical protein
MAYSYRMFKEPESKLLTPVVVVSLTAVKALDKSIYPAVKIVVASSLLAITAEQIHLSVAESTKVKTNAPDVNAVLANPLNKSNPELIAPALAVDVDPLIIDDVPLYPDVTYVGVPPVPNCTVKFPDVPSVDTAYNCNVIRFTQLGILVNPTLVPLTDTAVPAVMTLLAIELITAPVMVGLVSVLFVSVWVPVSNTAWLAGYVTKTFLLPAGKFTKLLELLDSKTVVLASVVPEEVYVPSPVSQFVPSVMQ